MAARTRFSARMNETPCGAFYWAAAGGGAGLRESPPAGGFFVSRPVWSPPPPRLPRLCDVPWGTLWRGGGGHALPAPSRALLAPKNFQTAPSSDQFALKRELSTLSASSPVFSPDGILIHPDMDPIYPPRAFKAVYTALKCRGGFPCFPRHPLRSSGVRSPPRPDAHLRQ